jgi:hypothetical protein
MSVVAREPDADTVKLCFEPLAFSHGVTVAGKERVRLLAEVTRFHARDSIPPDGGGGFGHSLWWVGAFMRPRDGGAIGKVVHFVGGFSGHQSLPHGL